MPGQQDALFDYDAELRHYQPHLRAAAAWPPHRPGPRHRLRRGADHAGSGQRWQAGSALGIDISAARLARARRLARAEGLRNVGFVQADAQACSFRVGCFDLAISRFGTMFFADPVAAFTSIGRALRPGGRLVQLVWQHRDRQEWDAVIDEIFTGAQPAPAPAAVPSRWPIRPRPA